MRTSWFAARARDISRSSTGSSNCPHHRGSNGCRTTSDASALEMCVGAIVGALYGGRTAHAVTVRATRIIM
jgi:hypothetical protein